MRVLHILSDGQLGGGPRHVRDLCQMPDMESGILMPDGPAWAWFPPWSGFRAPWARDWTAPWRLLRTLQRIRPDVLHTHGTWAGLVGIPIGRLMGYPVVHTHHGLHRTHVGWRVLDRLTTRSVHVSLSQAELAAQVGMWHERSRVVANGIDAAGVRRYATMLSHGPRYSAFGPDPIIVTLARRDPIKHLEVLEAAMQQLAAWHVKARLVVVSSHPDPLPTLARAAVYCAPSGREGLPYAVLEAMALGLPVVATAVPGHRDLLVEGVTGFLVPPGSHIALAAAIRDILEHQDRAEEMGRAGRERVERFFRVEDMWAGIRAVYEEVVSA